MALKYKQLPPRVTLLMNVPRELYYGFQKYCENQIKRATHTQHRLLLSSPYKSNAYHACTYYYPFQDSEALFLYCIVYLDQFMSVVGAMVARESLWKRAASQSTQGSQPIKQNTTTQLLVIEPCQIRVLGR